MLRKHEGRSPDGAACGAIRVCAQVPGLRRKRLHPGYMIVVSPNGRVWKPALLSHPFKLPVDELVTQKMPID